MVISATEAKNKLGTYLDKAQREPVTVESTGRPRAVIVGYEDYLRLQAMEDFYWAQRASESEKSGYLGAEATAVLVQGRLAAPDNAE